MRKLLLPLLAFFFAAPVTAATAVTTQPGTSISSKLMLSQASGDIKALGLSRIRVGHLTCSVPSGMSSVGRFVIGDPVAIGCKGGALNTIKYVPSSVPAETNSRSYSSTADTSSTAGTTTSTGAGANSFSFTMTPTSVTLQGASASGTVTGFDSSGLTIGDVTCLFNSGLQYQQLLSQGLHVGGNASMSCSTGSSGIHVMAIVFSASH